MSPSDAALPAGTLPPVWEALPRLGLGDWWKEEDLPIHWDRYLPPSPMEVEIGYGGGDFLLALAELSPQKRFVGLEHFGEGHRRLVAALKKRGIHNVLPLLGDAYITLQLLFEDSSIHAVYINCPDPWPKNRHARKRLLTAEMFGLVARKLESGGTLFVATDDAAYAQAAAAGFIQTPALESSHPGEPWTLESPYPTQTRYERRWRAEGRTMHYFRYRRRP